MNRYVSSFAVASLLSILSAAPSFAIPLTGGGALPFPGATGDPARQVYAAVGAGGGPFTGTWTVPANSAWLGTFAVNGPMPHTPPVLPAVTGIAYYDFTLGAGYLPGALPVGTYFQFGDLDGGAAENFELRAFSGTSLVSIPWLDTPFAATATAVATDMPNYGFFSGIYRFDGSGVVGNPSISVFLKNNIAITALQVTRSSTSAAFVLGAPLLIPEPSSLALALCGAIGSLGAVRRFRG